MDDPSGPSDRDADGSNAERSTDVRIGADRRSTSAGRAVPGDPRDGSTQNADVERRRNASLVSVVVAGLGAWVAASVLLFDVGAAILWNNLVVGVVVVLAGAYNYYRLSNDIPLSVGVASLVTLLGIWLAVSGVVLGTSAFLLWSTIASGLVVAGLAGYNAYAAQEARSVRAERGTEGR